MATASPAETRHAAAGTQQMKPPSTTSVLRQPTLLISHCISGMNTTCWPARPGR